MTTSAWKEAIQIIKWGVILTITIPVVAIFGLVMLLAGYNYVETIGNFSKEQWKEASRLGYAEISKIRCPMWRDLRSNYLKLGMTKQETEELLGKPSFKPEVFETFERVSYTIGTCGVAGYDLRISYGANGKISEIEVYQD